ncbi:MAG TPA: tyrosine-type recombinase/integrase [Vicinamibacterales bacterium]|nr:tyrosine-type recombinase/integrase [Vicinamibacterales bacterium]
MSSRRNVGEIIKRGRIYYIRYYDVKGRRRLETTKSTDRNEAEKQLRKRLTAKDAGVSADAAIGKLTLKEATDDLLNDYKVNGRRSRPEVKRKIELHLLPYFGERRRMTSITTADMRAFVVERQREEKDDDGKVTKRAASNAEINRELAALRRAFRLAVRAGRLVQCPYVPMLQERNTRRGFLEADQITAICSALPEEVRPVVKFAYATGWRTRSEILPLEWRNVDWGGRCVRLDAHTTKNGEARSFPFTTDLETILKCQLAIHETLKKAGRVVPFVFHRDGERIKEFRTAWKNACKAAGCPGRLIHDMRRSAVRTFERAGVPRSVAMSIVGHKTESIYRRYAIVDEAMQREAAVRLDAWAKSPPSGQKSGTVATFTPKAAKVTKPRRQRSA